MLWHEALERRVLLPMVSIILWIVSVGLKLNFTDAPFLFATTQYIREVALGNPCVTLFQYGGWCRGKSHWGRSRLLPRCYSSNGKCGASWLDSAASLPAANRQACSSGPSVHFRMCGAGLGRTAPWAIVCTVACPYPRDPSFIFSEPCPFPCKSTRVYQHTATRWHLVPQHTYTQRN